ncbi:TonB-dependent receptor domain-containing protein [Sphingomonas sp. SORGH_AS_0879]|uniref:TonB-dependent receptor domain-containing protein n=1 Tax=Sphingomonas sp. SORGH_AS_0879 TaxID=3041790 RepID=UPI00278167ED|nr:TonB-dependent receptor [Sphingomonas sp. SORGH_AS_0879]MDQ1229470.1 outer membrane receptor protein involved in Fe transport [Sphingomonas sp. SORGH_AS_0879]
MKMRTLLGASALASTLVLFPVAALAQTSTTSTTAPEVQEEDADTTSDAATPGNRSGGGDVVVTGSRIRLTNKFDAAIPVESINAAELLGTRGDISLGDAISQLPQLRSTFSQANSTGSIGTAGINLLDLRGLGTARTLTLVNGRRVVTAVPGSYTPDINTIPFDLLEGVDIVTGGQSAVYGSDAISGVVNFKLKRDFEGTRLRAQGGVTSYGDRGTYLVSGITGANFAEGRFNLTVSAEYSKSNPVFFAQRPYLGAYGGTPAFINSQITTAPNRNFDGIPNTTFVPRGSVFGNRSIGGTVVTTCPGTATAANAAQRAAICTGQNSPTGSPIAYNYLFQPDGSLLRDSPSTTGLVDNRAIGGGVLFGGTASGLEGAMLMPGLDRFLANILLNGDISPAFKPFVEFSFANVKATQQSTQPSFTGGTLSSTFSISNPFLTPAARATLGTILAPGATSFTLNRFNNDLGTRAEFHTRRTYRGVIGVRGDITSSGDLYYEVAGNYGRTENFYRTGGNVLLDNYRNAVNAVVAPAGYAGSNYVLNAQGARVICAVNATNSNAAPGCVPLNLFGQNAADPRAIDYIMHTSTRNQWAEQINATAFISGNTGSFFNLPGGPVYFSFGGEYRREDAFSGQDAITASGATFLNPAATFDPPAVNIKEAYGELRLPLLANIPFLQELTVEGAGRVSDYGGTTGSVWAWNAGLIWSPVRDLRFRGSFSRSVRAPNLSNLYASSSQTFATINDPCDQPGGTNAGNNITSNPNRARNCAAAGIPTTISFTDPTTGAQLVRPWTNQSPSNIPGINQGNIGLTPEVGNSFTVGMVYQPQQVPGLTLKVDYYNIRVKNVISGLTGQQIVNRCYDDTNGIDNPFCAAVFRRQSSDPVQNNTFLGQTGRTIDQSQFIFDRSGNGVSFINQPFNFAALKTNGLDVDVQYAKRFSENASLNANLTVSYIFNRLNYVYIAEPDRYDRQDSMLGDPKWQARFNLNGKVGLIDFGYTARYVGRQIVSGLVYETFFASQGRPALNPDARPFVYYSPIVYHDARIGVNATEKFRLYLGVDNITNQLPPYELTGIANTPTGNDAIYPNIGRFLYAGVEARF